MMMYSMTGSHRLRKESLALVLIPRPAHIQSLRLSLTPEQPLLPGPEHLAGADLGRLAELGQGRGQGHQPQEHCHELAGNNVPPTLCSLKIESQRLMKVNN